MQRVSGVAGSNSRAKGATCLGEVETVVEVADKGRGTIGSMEGGRGVGECPPHVARDLVDREKVTGESGDVKNIVECHWSDLGRAATSNWESAAVSNLDGADS